MVETAWTDAPSGRRAWVRTRGFERLVKKKNLRQKHTETRGIETAVRHREKEKLATGRDRHIQTHRQTIRSAQEHKEKHQEESVVLWGEGGGLRKEKKHRKLSRQPERELERHR